MKQKNGRFKIIFLMVLVILTIQMVRAESFPTLPIMIYGRVIYDNHLPAKNIDVKISWIDKEGIIKNVIVKTIDDKQNLELAGYYKLQINNINEGEIIRVESANRFIEISAELGKLTKINNLIIPYQPGFFDKILTGITSIISPNQNKKEDTNNESLNQPDNSPSQNNSDNIGEKPDNKKESENYTDDEGNKDNINNSDIMNNTNKNDSIKYYKNDNVSNLEATNKSYESNSNKKSSNENFFKGYKAIIFENIKNEYIFCENEKIDLKFNIKNYLNKEVETYLYPRFPENPFFIDLDKNSVIIFSKEINKNDTRDYQEPGYKIYQEKISVSDGFFSDYKLFNITLVEINNPPIIQRIGRRTIELENNLQLLQIYANDLEDGDSFSGNLTFNLYYNGKRIFNIDKFGKIYFNISNKDVGNYNLTICASDQGLFKGMPLNYISKCQENWNKKETCETISLAITNRNKKPVIKSVFPLVPQVKITNESMMNFSVHATDPDGSVPDIYWFLNEELKKYTNTNKDSFLFINYCDLNEKNSVKVLVTDGAINSTFEWIINKNNSICVEKDNLKCQEKYGCSEWSECYNLLNFFNDNKINKQEYNIVDNQCYRNNLNIYTCGYQKRNCIEINKCNTTESVPELIRKCYFVETPTCDDRIKDCHDNFCEVLVDCGGKCKECMTCSDRIKNNNEGGVDCGGVCENCVFKLIKKVINLKDQIIVIGVLVVLILICYFIIINILKRFELIQMSKDVKVRGADKNER